MPDDFKKMVDRLVVVGVPKEKAIFQALEELKKGKGKTPAGGLCDLPDGWEDLFGKVFRG